MNDNELMEIALGEARAAAEHDDVPVGALIVRDGEIISRAHNERQLAMSATAHAEILAIERACEKLGRWRLSDCTLYVTLEPCPMCAGAAINSRIKRVVFGAHDAKAGCFGSVLDFNECPFNHTCEVTSDVRAQESRELLSRFFEAKRKK